jgi:SnoaL-like domain
MKMISEAVTEIINTVNLYTVAVDSQTWDLFDQVFTADIRADFGGPAQWHDRASFKRDFAAVHAPFKATQHTISNHRVLVDGDRGYCFSYVRAMFIRDVPKGGDLFEGAGWYDDVLEQMSGAWRIKQRTNRTFWSGGNPLVLQTVPGITVELQHFMLKDEAAAGRVTFLNALTQRDVKTNR